MQHRLRKVLSSYTFSSSALDQLGEEVEEDDGTQQQQQHEQQAALQLPAGQVESSGLLSHLDHEPPDGMHASNGTSSRAL